LCYTALRNYFLCRFTASDGGGSIYILREQEEQMNEVISKISNQLARVDFTFSQKPIVIGGMAMEYYGMRKAGADIDFVICDYDYQKLSQQYPEKRKDIYGDLGVIIEPFEIWRSIALLDYNFYRFEAVDYEKVKMVSLDRLLIMRVFAMDIEKYMDDLKLMKEYYYSNFRNSGFLVESEQHIPSYKKFNGVIFGGNYEDSAAV
jgi:virulence-associated protein VapD